jgi:hypothetical protein
MTKYPVQMPLINLMVWKQYEAYLPRVADDPYINHTSIS